LTDATKDFARASASAGIRRKFRLSIRAGMGCITRKFSPISRRHTWVNGLDGLTTYTATPGQLGFPTCLTGSCLPLSFDPKTLAASQLPARDITIQAGRKSSMRLNFKVRVELRPAAQLPRQAVNRAARFVSIGVESELAKGLFSAAITCTNMDQYRSQRRSECPAPFDARLPDSEDRYRG